MWPVLKPGHGRVCGHVVACFYSLCMNCLLCWHAGLCADFVDICLFRYIGIHGCKSYTIDIIIHDTEYKIWYVNVSYSIHTVAFLHCICTGTLHWVGYECMVGKSILCLVFDWVGSVNGTTSNRVVQLIEMIKKKMCRVLERNDRSPLELKNRQLWSYIISSGERS